MSLFEIVMLEMTAGLTFITATIVVATLCNTRRH